MRLKLVHQQKNNFQKKHKTNKTMKKSIIITILGVFVSTAIFAQAFEIGVKGGVSLSQIKGEGSGSSSNFWNNEGSRATGFTGGIYTKFGNKLFLQPEFLITQKGGSYNNVLGVKQSFKQTYFDIPVLVGFQATENVRLMAGPVATFLVNKDDSFLSNLGLASNQNEGFRKALLGFQTGVGFDINKIRLDLRYEGNINDVFNIDYKDSQTESQFKGKGNAFSATIGYKF
jgi:hypothetical protein